MERVQQFSQTKKSQIFQKVLKNFGMTLAYFFLGWVGLLLAWEHHQVAALWPPSGLAFAAVFVCRSKYLPGLLLGAFSINFYVLLSQNYSIFSAVLPSALIGIGNISEALLGVYLYKKVVKEEFIFNSSKSVILFPLIAALPGSFLAGLVGVFTLCLFGLAELDNFIKLLFTWSFGDFAGIITLAPLLIFLRRYGFSKLIYERILEFIFFLILAAVVSFSVFNSAYIGEAYFNVLIYLVVPIITLTALRLGQMEVAFIINVTSMFAVLGIINVQNPVTIGNLNTVVLLLNIFFLSNFLTGFLASTSWENLKIAKIDTLQLAKLSGLGELSGKLAHEIGNPLHLILNYTEIIDREINNISSKDYKKIQDSLEKIREYAGRTQNIVKRTRDFHQRHQLIFNEVELSKIFKKATELLVIKTNEYNIDISFNDPDEVIVLGDSLYLEQAFYNILNNAVQSFSTINNERFDRKIEINVEKNKNFVSIQVKDNGPGIPVNKIDKIFSPEFSESKEGMGLGLTIVSSIINAHGGEVHVKNNEERGINFTIHLPLP